MMVVQIAQTHRHVMSNRIRHGNRHAETQDAMDQSDCVKVAIAQEESTRDDSPNESCHHEHKVRKVRCRKQHCGGNNCCGFFGQDAQQPEQKVILQDELLLESPE